MFFKSRGKKSDEELMQLLASGNDHALTEIYERYSKNMLRYFFRMLWKDEAKAQDFLQDLFLKIIEHPEYFNPSRKFSTWIYSVANNMCKNEYRKEALRKNIHDDDLRNAYMVVTSGNEDDDFRQALEIAILNLDEEDKHLYSLRFEIEISMEEIAAILECPVGTVKSRLFYLKKKLADQLMKQYPEKVKYGV